MGVLGPEIETVRRGFARSFGCDTEEMESTRNASEAVEIVQLGMDLKAGGEPDDRNVGVVGAAGKDCAEADSVSGAAAVAG